jgi:peroxiredoxin
MRLPRWSANTWLLVIAGVLLVGLAGEPAYRALTGRKTAEEIRLAKLSAEEMKMAVGPQVGDSAPAFSLKAADGRKVSLSDFRGQRVLISFFCGCYLCRGIASEWEKLAKAPLKNRPVLIGIHYFSPDRLQPFIEEAKAKDLLYLYDPDKEVGRRWGSKTCPRTWIVDEQGRIAYRHELADSEVPVPRTAVPRQVRSLLSQPKLQLTSARH